MRQINTKEKPEANTRRGGNRFSGFLCLLGGFVVLFFAARGAWDLARAQTWQAADCTVLSASYERRASMKSRTTYYPKIAYAYRFGERDFTGERFDLVGNYFETSDEANRALADFAAGARFTCFINPSNPQESVVARNVFQFPVFRYAAGLLVFFGFAALLLFSSPPKKPKRENGVSG